MYRGTVWRILTGMQGVKITYKVSVGGHSNSNQKKKKCVTGVTRNGVHHVI